mgnify:CR=1 FL=1
MADQAPLPASRQEALDLLDEWWPVWTAFLDELAARGEAEKVGREGWSAAEAVAHVARWQAWSVSRVAQLAAGERLAEVDIDGQNAGWAEEDRGISWAQARALAETSQAAFREAVAGVPEEGWRRSLGRLVVANSSEHYQEHMDWRATG